MEIYSEEEFSLYLRRLNGLFPSLQNWQSSKARKEHEDFFGEIIKRGEIYYKRSNGAGWDNEIKLSEKSMENIIYLIFDGNFPLQKLADEVIENRFDEMKRAVDKL